MELGIRKKLAVVMAGSSGLGKAAASLLAHEGARVVICARNEEKLREAAEQIQALTGNSVEYHRVDVGRKDELEAFFKRVMEKQGGVDILITNAGGPPAKNFFEAEDSDWASAFELTLMSMVRAVRQVLPGMKEKRSGRIVNITSMTVKQPLQNLILSNAMRSAVVAVAKTLAEPLAAFGITINNVAPGYHLTAAVERLIQKQMAEKGMTRDAVLEKWNEQIPAGRLAKPEELAHLITFLCSKNAGYITGQTIIHDGGFIRAL